MARCGDALSSSSAAVCRRSRISSINVSTVGIFLSQKMSQKSVRSVSSCRDILVAARRKPSGPHVQTLPHPKTTPNNASVIRRKFGLTPFRRDAHYQRACALPLYHGSGEERCKDRLLREELQCLSLEGAPHQN